MHVYCISEDAERAKNTHTHTRVERFNFFLIGTTKLRKYIRFLLISRFVPVENTKTLVVGIFTKQQEVHVAPYQLF
jgi:hypothetical protein